MPQRPKRPESEESIVRGVLLALLEDLQHLIGRRFTNPLLGQLRRGDLKWFLETGRDQLESLNASLEEVGSLQPIVQLGLVPEELSPANAPADQVVVGAYRAFTQLASVLKKYQGLGTPNPAASWEKFHKCEARCAEYNSRQGEWAPGPGRHLLEIARDVCSEVLGAVPDVSFIRKAHGPGVVLSGPMSPDRKYGFGGLFNPLVHALQDLEGSLTLRLDARGFHYESSLCNRVTFVPKDRRSVRIIAIEDVVPQFYQLGIGLYIRNRLRKVLGIDLRDQAPNQEMARVGSLDRSLATIDLSSASDTIASKLVFDLLPGVWSSTLSSTASKEYELEGVRYPYEKFSSQGNGFTFSLETLIFSSIVLATVSYMEQCDWRSLVGSGRFRCYGDDIVVPTQHFHAVLGSLAMFGFIPNNSKSFGRGPFRESCGGDYLSGYLVTPLYLRRKACAQTLLDFGANLQTERYTRFGERLVLFSATLRAIARCVRREWGFVPVKGSTSAYPGLIGDLQDAKRLGRGRVRWNKDLQRWEIRAAAFVQMKSDDAREEERYNRWLHEAASASPQNTRSDSEHSATRSPMGDSESRGQNCRETGRTQSIAVGPRRLQKGFRALEQACKDYSLGAEEFASDRELSSYRPGGRWAWRWRAFRGEPSRKLSAHCLCDLDL